MISSNLNLKESRELLLSFCPSPSLLEHCEDVGCVMKHTAIALSINVDQQERWQIAGLLHDADWEASPDEHPSQIAGRLATLGEHDIADAITTHYTGWGHPPRSLMGRALLAADELTGFIRAYLRIRSSDCRELTLHDVRRKLRDRSFARSCERDEIARALAQSPVPEDQLVSLIVRVLDTRRQSGVAP